jgi:hypothetical protein
MERTHLDRSYAGPQDGLEMTKNDDQPAEKTKKAEARAERDARLADALRANLNRRKAQIRAREAGDGDGKNRENSS